MQGNISVKISDMDYDKAVQLIKNNIHTSNSIEKMAIGFMANIPSKLFITKLISTDSAKFKIMDNVNRQFEENNLDITIYNFFAKTEPQASLDIYCKIGDISSFIEKKINFKDDNLNSIVKCSVNSVLKEIPDSLKASLLNKVFKDVEPNICNYISKLVSEKYFNLNIESIVFYASEI